MRQEKVKKSEDIFMNKTAEDIFVKGYAAHKIIPTPFALLGDEGRELVMSRFEQFLNSIDTPILIYINPEWEVYKIDDAKFDYLDLNYYIIIDKEKSESVNGFFDVDKSFVEEDISKNVFSQRPVILEEYPNYLKIRKRKFVKTSEGVKVIWSKPLYGRAYILSKLGAELPAGVMLDFIKFIEDAMIYIEPIDDSTAISYADKARIRLESLLSEKPSLSIQARARRLDLLAARIMAGIKIHRFSLVFTVAANSPEELKIVHDKYVRRLRRYLLHFDKPSFVQGDLFSYKFKTKVFGIPVEIIKKITIDSHSLRLFYPFISDNITHPEGIFLGINPDMKQPIIYNPYKASNYNIVILGATGFGKSMTTKVLLRRLLQRMPDAYLYIIDPEGEYAEAAKLLVPHNENSERGDIQVLKIEPGKELGLDMIKMLLRGDLHIEEVADMIIDLYDLPPQQNSRIRGDLQEALDNGVDNIFDFVKFVEKKYAGNKNLEDNYLSVLRGIKAPPDNAVYSGEEVKIGDRVIFDISAIENERTKVAITTLISTLLTRKLMLELPRSAKKIFAVDEAWLFTNYKSTMYLFKNIARRGRKRGIIFMFITQRPEDVIKNDAGRTILEQSQTSILLGQTEKGVAALKELYQLTDDEADYLTKVQPGNGILRIGDIKTKIYIVVTNKELEVFTTKVVE